jgi:hypothetical protein
MDHEAAAADAGALGGQTGGRMTDRDKAAVLFAVLQCAPIGQSKARFAKYAATGDVEGLFGYYLEAIARRQDVRRSVESVGRLSFERLRPAMDAIYRLPRTK